MKKITPDCYLANKCYVSRLSICYPEFITGNKTVIKHPNILKTIRKVYLTGKKILINNRMPEFANDPKEGLIWSGIKILFFMCM